MFQFATGAFLGTEHLLRPDIYQQGSRRARNSPAASTSTTHAMTSGSATGSASTRPPDRRLAFAGDDQRSSRGRVTPPLLDSKIRRIRPFASTCSSHAPPLRYTQALLCLALIGAQNNYSSPAWSDSDGDRVATHNGSARVLVERPDHSV